MTERIKGERVVLADCSRELWHEFYKGYISDPMMDSGTYSYNPEHIDKIYLSKINDATRLYFFILLDGRVIGQIYLKRIDKEKRTCEFGIALTDDSVKEKGYGGEAIRLLLNYAFNDLSFEKIFADTLLRNVRSQHVLEKLGFVFLREDSEFKYYATERAQFK